MEMEINKSTTLPDPPFSASRAASEVDKQPKEE
jgi:hypothetical protein